ICYSINTQNEDEDLSFQDTLNSIFENESKTEIPSYKIIFKNAMPESTQAAVPAESSILHVFVYSCVFAS
ncbi:MAG: hypothetical protein IJ936_07845, partial [Peptococcaceae bacterium]|nr:hypothetical protein [Peptococcaceae bacterium]